MIAVNDRFVMRFQEIPWKPLGITSRNLTSKWRGAASSPAGFIPSLFTTLLPRLWIARVAGSLLLLLADPRFSDTAVEREESLGKAP